MELKDAIERLKRKHEKYLEAQKYLRERGNFSISDDGQTVQIEFHLIEKDRNYKIQVARENVGGAITELAYVIKWDEQQGGQENEE